MGIKIHEYLLERFTFGDNDYYDIDYFDGATYQTAKIKGSTIKAGILASISPENIYTQDGALQGQRTVDLNDYSLKFYTEFGETILIVANNGDSDKILQWKSENATRWELVVNNDISGSDIELKRYDGAGNYADSPFKIDRATGTITFNENYSFPLTDGTNGQVLTTDGAGNLTFEDVPTQATTWGSITGTLSSQTDLQTALNAKQDTLVSGTNIKSIEGQSLLGSGNIDLTKSDVGLSNVDNTSDLNKPISTATQTALNGKFDDPTGTSAQYIDGTGALQTFPTFLDSDALITEVYNNSGATLTKGTIVYINGGQGNLPTVVKAQANSDATSAQTFGWVRDDITDMNNGFVVVIGKLTDLNTNGLGNGTQLYLSPTTAGAYTVTKPVAPQHLVYVGVVVRDHPTQGVIEVKIQNGYELDEIHDVLITSPIDGQTLQYDSGLQVWKNVTPSSPTQTELDPVINVLNTPPATPTVGDRYRVGTAPTGAWVGQNNKIAQWDGTTWQYTTPVTDNIVYQTTTATTFRYNGSAWVQWAGTPIVQNGNTLGTTLRIGTNDNFAVAIKRNNTDVCTFGNGSTVFRNVGGAFSTFAHNALTNQSYVFPNASGTIALTTSPAFLGTPTAPTASSGTNTTQLATTAFVQDAVNKQPEAIQVACSDETTNLTTGTSKITFRMPFAMTLTGVRASLSTAQTAGVLLTVDINQNGTSVLGTKLTFDNTEKTTTTAVTPATIVTSALTDDAEITVDIDQVGTAGARGLKVTLIGTRA